MRTDHLALNPAAGAIRGDANPNPNPNPNTDLSPHTDPNPNPNPNQVRFEEMLGKAQQAHLHAWLGVGVGSP